ncbi:MAG: malto-oligosyltrehalose trehalohydrolase, partial [Bacteroidota bacterium]
MNRSNLVFRGALPDAGGTRFRVWAPEKNTIDVLIEPDGTSYRMERSAGGYFATYVEGVGPGARYRYRMDDGPDFPDPASRFQPEGVHGPSEVIDPSAYSWTDDSWEGIRMDDVVFYELHVGTFTREGSFEGVRQRLRDLRDLGVTALELMPVADFPGRWNWGYDHAALFAPSRAYGRPDDLRRLVDEAHRMGLAVFLDVIYNHFGPDGAYAAAFAPFFTRRHSTPWGMAINLDDRFSEGVRQFFLDNARYWLEEFHIDGLRLDATHALIDDSPKHFLVELAEMADGLSGPKRHLVAEDHRNLSRLLRPRRENGYGLDAVWADDLHHLIRNRTAGDVEGYYANFAEATIDDIAETITRGWYYMGQPSRATGKPRGTDPSGISAEKFVVFIQNHDQVGNRPTGDRLSDDIPLDTYRAVSALILFVPQTPLLFMGQEWATRSPFLFFTDHNDELGRAVTEGRKKEFEDFAGFEGEVPDPQHPRTFERSKLDWSERDRAPHDG